MSALRGKAVLLDIWGAWCGYCREALPGIEMIHRGLKDKACWPTTVLIDHEGKIVYYGSGDEPQKLRDAIRAVGVWQQPWSGDACRSSQGNETAISKPGGIDRVLTVTVDDTIKTLAG